MRLPEGTLKARVARGRGMLASKLDWLRRTSRFAGRAEGGCVNRDEIDRILLSDDEITPPSGFTASVMQAIRAEAAGPHPIPFPWKHALPGIAAFAGSLSCW